VGFCAILATAKASALIEMRQTPCYSDPFASGCTWVGPHYCGPETGACDQGEWMSVWGLLYWPRLWVLGRSSILDEVATGLVYSIVLVVLMQFFLVAGKIKCSGETRWTMWKIRDAQAEQDGEHPNRAHLKLGSEDPKFRRSTWG